MPLWYLTTKSARRCRIAIDALTANEISVSSAVSATIAKVHHEKSRKICDRLLCRTKGAVIIGGAT